MEEEIVTSESHITATCQDPRDSSSQSHPDWVWIPTNIPTNMTNNLICNLIIG